jgi:hypothetical protein
MFLTAMFKKEALFMLLFHVAFLVLALLVGLIGPRFFRPHP